MMLFPSASEIHDAAIADHDFMKQWMAFLARRANLHQAAYVDLAEILSENFAFLSTEDKSKVASIVTSVKKANDFFQEMADSALLEHGLIPSGDELADELLNSL